MHGHILHATRIVNTTYKEQTTKLLVMILFKSWHGIVSNPEVYFVFKAGDDLGKRGAFVWFLSPTNHNEISEVRRPLECEFRAFAFQDAH